MKFIFTLLSFPALIWAYFWYPWLNQFSWKWLVAGFIVYCFLLLRFLVRVLESPQNYGFLGGHSGGGTMDTGGGIFDGGGDCGGGGDC